MPTVQLKNVSVEKRKTINNKPFFLLRNPENSEVYFCFENSKAWKELIPEKIISECELEFKENSKGKEIIDIWIESTNEILI